jgi:hypothetical protein
VLAVRTSESPGICPDIPDRMFGVSSFVPGESGPSA